MILNFIDGCIHGLKWILILQEVTWRSLPQASGSPPAEEHLRAGGWSQARAIESLAVVV